MDVPMQVNFEFKGDICILRLRGKIHTGADAEYLCSKVDELRATGSSKVIADLSEVPYLDSTGIGFLVGLYTSTMNRKGGSFIVSNPGPRVRHVLQIMRLAEIVPIAADEVGAIQMLNLPQKASANV